MIHYLLKHFGRFKFRTKVVSGENSPEFLSTTYNFKVLPWATPSFFQGQYRREGGNSGGCLLGTDTKRLLWKSLSLLLSLKALGILYGPSQLGPL